MKLLHSKDYFFWEKILENTKYIQTTDEVLEILNFIIEYKKSYPDLIPDLYNKFDKTDINKLNKSIENLRNIGLI